MELFKPQKLVKMFEIEYQSGIKPDSCFSGCSYLLPESCVISINKYLHMNSDFLDNRENIQNIPINSTGSHVLSICC